MHSPPSPSETSTQAPARPVPRLLWLALAVGLALALAVPDPWWIRYLFAGELLLLGFWRRSMSLWIVLMMILGCMLGADFKHYGPALGLPVEALQVPSKVFIRLVKTVVAPLLFATLTLGISSHADLRTVGRLGIKSMIYFEVVTTVALFLGLGAINFSKAGVGITQALSDTGGEKLQVVHKSVIEILLHTFPENIAKSVAEGDVLQIVVFSIIFGTSMVFLEEGKRKPLLDVIEGLAETMFKFTALVMMLAPLAVGSAVAYTIAKMGLGVLNNLLALLFTLYGALIAFVLLVLLPIILVARIPLVPFLRAISQPVGVAFATSTSEAALPQAMERLKRLGVPGHVVSFVMPLGYSFNLDGTTLYLALASVFVAQAAGQSLPLSTQIAMMLSLMLSSKGVAGVPRASLVILLGTVATFNLPEWPVTVILGIDGIMDMARTSVNVTGNCLAATVVARWEGNFVPNYQDEFYVGHRPADFVAESHPEGL